MGCSVVAFGILWARYLENIKPPSVLLCVRSGAVLPPLSVLWKKRPSFPRYAFRISVAAPPCYAGDCVGTSYVPWERERKEEDQNSDVL